MIGAFDDLPHFFANNVYIRLIKHTPMKWGESIKQRFRIFWKWFRSSKGREDIYEVIFGANTYHGRLFDVFLLVFILISVLLVTLESVPSINAKHHKILVIFEWIITILFTLEYGLRLYSTRRPWKYFFSFYGIIDLLSIIPTYLGLLYPSTKFLSSIRILRLIRIFRIFKLTQFLRGGNVLLIALQSSRTKIVVFLSFVTLVGVFLGSVMYVVESWHPESMINTMPVGIYWAIVTLTTVGYGDITPVTTLGRVLASVVMIIGYGVIAVPTGIFAAETLKELRKSSTVVRSTIVCKQCQDDNHLLNSNFCKSCGSPLDKAEIEE